MHNNVTPNLVAYCTTSTKQQYIIQNLSYFSGRVNTSVSVVNRYLRTMNRGVRPTHSRKSIMYNMYTDSHMVHGVYFPWRNTPPTPTLSPLDLVNRNPPPILPLPFSSSLFLPPPPPPPFPLSLSLFLPPLSFLFLLLYLFMTHLLLIPQPPLAFSVFFLLIFLPLSCFYYSLLSFPLGFSSSFYSSVFFSSLAWCLFDCLFWFFFFFFFWLLLLGVFAFS